MKIKTILLTQTFLLTLGASFIASAHGPTPQRVDEKIEILASADSVWEKIQAFDSINEWHPKVTHIVMQDPTTRILTLDNGEEITESLDDVNAENQSIGYRLLTENFEAIPVSFYTISIQVEKAEEDKTLLNWSGRFYRADTGNFPPENLNDAAAVSAMTEFAQSGLEGLKSAIESQGK